MIEQMMLEQLTLTLERKLFIDEINALEKQLRALNTRIKNSPLITDQLIIMQSGIESNITEMKKVLKSKGLL
jgi:hypothetical protein